MKSLLLILIALFISCSSNFKTIKKYDENIVSTDVIDRFDLITITKDRNDISKRYVEIGSLSFSWDVSSTRKLLKSESRYCPTLDNDEIYPQQNYHHVKSQLAIEAVKSGSRLIYRDISYNTHLSRCVATYYLYALSDRVKKSSVLRRQIEPDLKNYIGTALQITNDGYFLTSYDLVQNAKEIKVINNNESLNAILIEKDKINGIAILKIENNSSVNLNKINFKINNKYEIKLGDTVKALGYSTNEDLGAALKFSEGVVGSLEGIESDPRIYQVNMANHSISSGSPIFNRDNQLIGLSINLAEETSFIKHEGILRSSITWVLRANYIQNLCKTSNINICNSGIFSNNQDNSEKLEQYIYKIEIMK